ncbi:MAG: hypothetical protein VXV96_08185 [Bdellovibrionota bacterium]|nr:hypothetical protein [Bdellovibrionota bacterium]
MTLINYFKHQFKYLAFLLGVFVTPLALFLQFSPYKEPRATYVVLIVLVVSQYAYYNEKRFRNKIEKDVSHILKGELKRVPSRKEIAERSTFVVKAREFSIVLSGILILSLMFFYQVF